MTDNLAAYVLRLHRAGDRKQLVQSPTPIVWKVRANDTAGELKVYPREHDSWDIPVDCHHVTRRVESLRVAFAPSRLLSGTEGLVRQLHKFRADLQPSSLPPFTPKASDTFLPFTSCAPWSWIYFTFITNPCLCRLLLPTRTGVYWPWPPIHPSLVRILSRVYHPTMRQAR